jgi:hypothetical protein
VPFEQRLLITQLASQTDAHTSQKHTSIPLSFRYFLVSGFDFLHIQMIRMIDKRIL